MSLLIKAGGITKLSELDIDAAPGKAKDIVELILTTRGDVLYRNVLAARLAPGAAGKYLQTRGEGHDPVWSDVYGGIPERYIELPTLTIPEPTVGVVVAEDHSGGGHVAEPDLTIPVPTIGDVAELSWLLLDDCEAAWDEYVQANVTSTADGAVKKIGAASAKMAVADLATVGRLATHDIGPFDLSPYKYIKAWIYSSIGLSSGDLSLLLDNHGSCVSPEKDLDIGDIPATTWTQVTIDMGDTSGLGAIISIGIDMDIDQGIFDFYIDQVRATKGGA